MLRSSFQLSRLLFLGIPSPRLAVAHSTYDRSALDDESPPPLPLLLPLKPKPFFSMSFRILFPSSFLIWSETEEPADAANYE